MKGEKYILWICLLFVLLYYPRLHKTYLLVVETVVFSELLVIIFAADSLTGLHFMRSIRQVTLRRRHEIYRKVKHKLSLMFQIRLSFQSMSNASDRREK